MQGGLLLGRDVSHDGGSWHCNELLLLLLLPQSASIVMPHYTLMCVQGLRSCLAKKSHALCPAPQLKAGCPSFSDFLQDIINYRASFCMACYVSASYVVCYVFRLSAGVQILFYFLFGNNMIALSFLMSCLFTSAKTVVVFGFLWVFGSGLVGDLLLRNFIQADQWFMVLIELVPAFSLYRWVRQSPPWQRSRQFCGHVVASGSSIGALPRYFVTTCQCFLGLSWGLSGAPRLCCSQCCDEVARCRGAHNAHLTPLLHARWPNAIDLLHCIPSPLPVCSRAIKEDGACRV